MPSPGIGATPPLDNAALRTMDPVELAKVISRGRYNTAMPAWNIEDGGPLSDYQIEEVIKLIQHGNWQLVRERVVNLGLAPSVPFASEPDEALISQVVALPNGDLLVKGIEVYSRECVACHGADGSGTNLAPPLNTPDIQARAPEELERTIRLGVPGTLMAGWGQALPDDDINAVIALLTHWSEVPTGTIPQPDQPVPVTEESLALGENLYAQNCAMCHGATGMGTRRAPALNAKSFLENTSDLALQQIITLGVSGTAMPAWGNRLTEAEIQAIVGFLRSWEPTAPELSDAERYGGVSAGGGPPWQNNQAGGRGGGPPWRATGGTTPVSPTSSAVAPSTPQANATPQQNVTPQPTVQAHIPQGPPPGRGTGQHNDTTGGSTFASWWSSVDVYAVLLLGGMALLGLWLTIIGYRGATARRA